jgi:hypothetical protein
MVVPVLSGAALPSALSNACQKSGISGYYTSASSAVFNMVNIVVENIIGIDIEENAKKEVPAKEEDQKNENSEAVILNNFQKSFQTDLSSLSDFINIAAVWRAMLARKAA